MSGVPNSWRGSEESYKQHNERNRARNKQRHETTRPLANRTGLPFNDYDLEVCSRNDLTIEQMALLTGRSYSSINAFRIRKGIKTYASTGSVEVVADLCPCGDSEQHADWCPQKEQ